MPEHKLLEMVATGDIEKVGKGMLGLGLARKAASKVAKGIVTDEKLASAVAKKMSAAIGPACAERGIALDISKKYSRGAYVVLRVAVTELDQANLLSSAKGPEYAEKFGEL